MRKSLLPILLLCWPLGGCGIVVQAVIGWNDEETRIDTRTHQLHVESAPEGAQVSRTDGKTEPRIVGVTPLMDQVEYQVQETVSTPRAWGLLGTGIAEVVVGGVLAGVGRATQTESCSAVDLQCDRTGGTAFFVTGGALLVFGAVDAIWGIIRLFQSPEKSGISLVGEPRYTYFLEKDGVTKSAEVAIPSARGAKIDLGTGEVVATDVPRPLDEQLEHRVIAVMDVQDANQGQQEAVGDAIVRNLSDQLRIFVAQQGVKTVDRTAQVKALKLESYERCYDDSCQIELGKALAASHILRSKITKFGSRCVLNGELIDLTKEVTIKAASSQGTCQPEGFLEMSEAVARDLMKH